MELNYPYNLLKDLYGYNKTEDIEAEIASFNADKEAGLNYALETIAPEHKELLMNRYCEDKSFKELAAQGENGRNPQQIKATVEKALRQLRHPFRLKYVMCGLEATEQAIMNREEERVQDVRNRFPSVSVQEVSECFGTRAFRVVEKYKISDLINMSDEDLGKLRNCGANTIRDIRNGIEEVKERYGISDTELDAKNELRMEIDNNLDGNYRVSSITFNQKDNATADMRADIVVQSNYDAHTIQVVCKDMLISATCSTNEAFGKMVSNGIEDFINNSQNASVLFGENASPNHNTKKTKREYGVSHWKDL